MRQRCEGTARLPLGGRPAAGFAHAFLAPTAHQPRGKGDGTGETAETIELSVAEIRRLLAACHPQPAHLRGHRGRHHAVSWSWHFAAGELRGEERHPALEGSAPSNDILTLEN